MSILSVFTTIKTGFSEVENGKVMVFNKGQRPVIQRFIGDCTDEKSKELAFSYIATLKNGI